MSHSNVILIDRPQRRARGGGIVVETGDAAQGGSAVEIGEDGSVTVTVGQPDAPKPARTGAPFDRNLAEDLDQGALDALGAWLLDGIDADEDARREWLETANQGALYLGVKLEDPKSDVSADGTVCQTVATCLLEANIKLWSTARAELLPVGGPVKVRRDDLQTGVPQLPVIPALSGTPPAASEMDSLANALEQDLNWYLTVGDREYYPDFSKMLRARALIGNAFRKVYHDPLLRKPVSRWVKAQDLIISNDCTHLAGAGRITERIRMRQFTMRRMQRVGAYLDVVLALPTGETTSTEEAVAEIEGIAAAPMLPADMEHVVFECRCELSSAISMFGATPELRALDRDENGHEPGFPLPYRVAIDKDSRKVLEVRRNWKPGDPDYRARRAYVKYGFIPGDGFYDWGLIHLAGNPTLAASMIQRSTVDSTLYANFPGGMVAKGVGSLQTNTVVRPGPGQWVPVPVAGDKKIGDIFMPNPYKPPSPEALQMEQKFEADVRRIAGVVDLPVGEGRIGNTPVGTMMSYIEAVSQVSGAVHKDDHIAQAEEYDLLRELIAEQPEVLTRGNRSPARQWQIAEEITDPDLVPAADPNTPSAVHRLFKAQALVSLAGTPQFGPIMNLQAALTHVLQSIGTGNPAEFIKPPQQPAPAPPDPRIVAAQIKAQSDQAKAQAQAQSAALKQQTEAAEMAQDSIDRAEDRQSEETRAAMTLAGTRIKAATDAATATADRTHDAAQQNAERVQQHAHHVDTVNEPAQEFAPPFNGPQP